MYLEKCLEHIVSLDPKNQLKVHTAFSRRWLADPTASCPPSTDACILLFMHENNIYRPGGEEAKIVGLIQKLRKGTELENLRSGIEYSPIETRVMKRLEALSTQIFELGFIKHDGDYNWSKHASFRE